MVSFLSIIICTLVSHHQNGFPYFSFLCTFPHTRKHIHMTIDTLLAHTVTKQRLVVYSKSAQQHQKQQHGYKKSISPPVPPPNHISCLSTISTILQLANRNIGSGYSFLKKTCNKSMHIPQPPTQFCLTSAFPLA